MNEVTIRIPATTANLGPGYDALGVALQIYNRVTVRRVRDGEARLIDNMPAAAAAMFFSLADYPPFPFVWEIAGDVPRSRTCSRTPSISSRLAARCPRPADSPPRFPGC